MSNHNSAHCTWGSSQPCSQHSNGATIEIPLDVGNLSRCPTPGDRSTYIAKGDPWSENSSDQLAIRDESSATLACVERTKGRVTAGAFSCPGDTSSGPERVTRGFPTIDGRTHIIVMIPFGIDTCQLSLHCHAYTHSARTLQCNDDGAALKAASGG